MQFDAEFFLDVFRVVNLRTEDVDFVTASRHFRDEINGFRRAAAGRRIKRFVREKRDAKAGRHRQTLDDLGARVQPISRGGFLIWWVRRCRDARRCRSTAATKSGQYTRGEMF